MLAVLLTVTLTNAKLPSYQPPDFKQHGHCLADSGPQRITALHLVQKKGLQLPQVVHANFTVTEYVAFVAFGPTVTFLPKVATHQVTPCHIKQWLTKYPAIHPTSNQLPEHSATLWCDYVSHTGTETHLPSQHTHTLINTH